MMKFTIPEINLICIYAGKSIDETVDNLIQSMPDYNEHEFTKIAESAIDKFETLSEAEFAEYNFAEQFTDDYVEYAE